MNNFFQLLKINLQSLFASNFKTKKAKNIIVISLILALCLILSFSYSYLIANGLDEINDYSSLITLWTLLTTALIVILFITSSNNLLYKSKDNDLLLSLPISKYIIALSKLISILVFGFLFEFVLLMPAGIVFFIKSGVTLYGLISFIFGLLFVPLLPLFVCTTISWIFSFLGRNFKHKNLFSIIFMILFFIVFFYFYMQVDFTNIANVGDATYKSIITYLPNLKWFIISVTKGNLLYLLFNVLSGIIGLTLSIFLVGYTYFKMCNYTKQSNFTKSKIDYKHTSVFKTLLKKDFRIYFSSPTYVVNTILGLVFILAISIISVVNKQLLDSLIVPLGIDPSNIFILLSFGFTFMLSTCCTSGVSISMERKNFDNLKCMPIKHTSILYSKLFMNVILCIPIILISCIIPWIGFRCSFVNFLIMLSTPIITCLFISSFGILANLFLPNLKTDNDTMIVKQSASSFVSLFLPMMFILLLLVLYFTLLAPYISLTVMYLIFCSILLILTGIINFYLIKKSKNRFEKINS